MHVTWGPSRSWPYGSWIYNCAISTYHHKSCEFESRSWWGVLETTLCDKVCQWLVFSGYFWLLSRTCNNYI